MIISERIFYVMEQENITQLELSKRTGIATSNISDWKKKKTNPKADCLLSICDALDITPEQLLTGKGIDPEYKDEMIYLKSSCDSVFRKLEHEMQNRELSFDQREMLANAKILLECDFKHEIDFRPQHFFRVVLSRWDILGNYTYTFRMLYAVVALSNPILWDHPVYRLKARDIIAEVCKDWDH